MIVLVVKQTMGQKYFNIYYGATESEAWDNIKSDGLQQAYRMEWQEHFSEYTDGMVLINTINNSFAAGEKDILQQLHCDLGVMRYDCEYIAYTPEDEALLSERLDKVIPLSTLLPEVQEESISDYRTLMDTTPEDRDSLGLCGGICVANVTAKDA